MKKGIWIGVSVFVVAILVWVVVVVAGVGGEAAKMDAMMKDDVQQHKSLDEVKKQLTDAGYTIQGDDKSMKADGPKHSLLVYTTWLTINLGFDENAVLRTYHLDRTS